MTILMHVMHSYDAYEKGGRLCTLQVPMTARCMRSGVGRCLILGWGGGRMFLVKYTCIIHAFLAFFMPVKHNRNF